MQYTILLNRNENTRDIEKQEQSRFLKSVFEILQLPVEYDPEKQLTTEEQIQLKRALQPYSISIIDDMAGGLKVFVERDLVAEWKKPTYALKRDHSILDPNKQLYLEMTIRFMTVFDD